MLSESALPAVAITLKLAGLSTLILLLLGTPLAWWLARTRWRFKFLLEAVVALPLVLPPTVLGFYLLVALGPHGPVGGLMEALGGRPLAFTFTGLVIGSVFYSMPFVVQPLQDAFRAVGRRPLEVAATLRAAPLDRFTRISLADIALPVKGIAKALAHVDIAEKVGGDTISIPATTTDIRVTTIDIDIINKEPIRGERIQSTPVQLK